jgi:hypothetical protein
MRKANMKAKIMMMVRQGMNVSEIAEKVGTSVGYVYVVRSRMKKDVISKHIETILSTTDKPMLKDKPLSPYEIHLKNSLAQARVDMVNHPPHYTVGGIETIDFIEAKKLGYNLGNVVKYITRSDLKGDRLENLKKAQWYLNREIKNEGVTK